MTPPVIYTDETIIKELNLPNNKLLEDLSSLLEDYLFIKINRELVLFWRVEQEREIDINNNEDYTLEDVVETCLEHNKIEMVDSHYQMLDNGIDFLEIVQKNLDIMNKPIAVFDCVECKDIGRDLRYDSIEEIPEVPDMECPICNRKTLQLNRLKTKDVYSLIII